MILHRFQLKIHCLLMAVLTLTVAVATSSCRDEKEIDDNSRVIRLNSSDRIKSLDPALGSDSASMKMIAVLYDTLLQYDYMARPYKLIPSMLSEMPDLSDDQLRYHFTLRDDLIFPHNRQAISSRDVAFSILRIADGRLHSPLYWMYRGKIAGIDEFNRRTGTLPAGDFSPYETGIDGIKIINSREFEITLTRPDPRFLYMLALPFSGVVCRTSAEALNNNLNDQPIGSGPFILARQIKDYRLEFVRNEDYRLEYFPQAENPADRMRRLPLADKIICSIIKQNQSSWLMFLQGELDMSLVDKDGFDAVFSGSKLNPALQKRGIRVIQRPEFEIRYIGFNFTDPKLGRNPALRKAISLAYNPESRVDFFNGQLLEANSPLPDGVSGFDASYRNPYQGQNIELAKKYLVEAGYPGGIDPESNEPLKLNFDLNGSSSSQRQLGEMFASDLRKIGIEIEICLNNSPRFFQKLRQGQMQLFRISWVGDYPDGENFLQLFFSGNAGGANRAFFSDAEFDLLYRRAVRLNDSPERNSLYRSMVELVNEHVVWIYEGYPVANELAHEWISNYYPHDFAFSRWKYIGVDMVRKQARCAAFTPLSFSDMSIGDDKVEQSK